MSLLRKTDHIDEALTWFIERFKNKPIIAAWLSSYVEQIQLLENAAWDVYYCRFLDYAEGSQLDYLGARVGESRKNRSDSDYRYAIRRRIAINKISGTPEEILTALNAFFNGTYELSYYYPMSFVARLMGGLEDSDPDAKEFLELLLVVKQAGEQPWFQYSEKDNEYTFMFADGDIDETNSNQGWSNEALTVGGYWSDVVDENSIEYEEAIFYTDGVGSLSVKFAGSGYCALLWGDGLVEDYKLPASSTVKTHTYGSAGLKKIVMTNYDLSTVSVLDAQIGLVVFADIYDLKKLSNLNTLAFTDARCSGDLSDLTCKNTIVNLVLHGAAVTGDLSELKDAPLLSYLDLSNTSVEGSINFLESSTIFRVLLVNNTAVSGNIDALSLSPSTMLWVNITNTNISGNISVFSTMTSVFFLYAANTQIYGDLSSLSALTALVTLDVPFTNITGNLSVVSSLTLIKNLYLNNNLNIEGSLSYVATKTSLERADLSYTSCAGDLSLFSFSTGLLFLHLEGLALSYTAGLLPAWSNADINIASCGLSSAEIDDFLIDLNTAGGSNGVLNLAGTNASRTSASNTAKSGLLSRGWVITVNE